MFSPTTQSTSQEPGQVNMLIVAFLLFTGVRSEWVEISQNNYRPEPVRLKQKFNHDHVTEVNVRYKNQTLTPQWKRGTINKVSKIANVMRVPYASVKTPSIRPNLEDFMEKRPSHPSSSPVQLESPFETFGVINKSPHFIEEDKAKIHRIHDRYKNFTVMENDGLYIGNNTRFNVDKVVSTFSHRFDSDVNELQYVQVPNNMEQSFEINQSLRNGNIDNINSITAKNVMNEQTPSTRKQLSQVRNPQISNIANNKETNPKNETNNLNIDQEGERYTGDINKKSKGNIIRDENKMEGMWKALRIVAEIISKHTRRSFKSKVRYLEDLKENIIASIEDHVDNIWPDDGVPHRKSRSAQARGHVEIPSSEGALMTISFLTFAVFLIKLVLQVIHTYKHKTMMLSPAVLAAVGRTAARFKQNYP